MTRISNSMTTRRIRKLAWSIIAMVMVVSAQECQTCNSNADCEAAYATTTAPSPQFLICDLSKERCGDDAGLFDIGCGCSNGEDCASGRCEGIFGKCQAKLDVGEGCNEDSDCVSQNCGFVGIVMRCKAPATLAPTQAPTTAQLRGPDQENGNRNDGDDENTPQSSSKGDEGGGSTLGTGVIIALALLVVVMIICCICFCDHESCCVPCTGADCNLGGCEGCQ
mmetsp:Transcript_23716/g.66979  ORF Transcript_23716/g.66979 Transcript_23716/m.66979 type:complete len:223 (+) Transcript_23716:25-693(+)